MVMAYPVTMQLDPITVHEKLSMISMGRIMTGQDLMII